ncbi:MAG: FKBP-type peptidyl-prolyl cis-trans isomerase [Neisseria sp.]|nr:FKBP-type peptidyl-prolyl cis-trans isomerase [Neisseria sp.]
MKTYLKFSALAVAATLSLAACKQETNAAAPAASAEKTSPESLGTLPQQASYAMGIEIGNTLKQIKDHGTEVDLKLFNEAIETVLAGKEPKLDMMQAQEVMMKFLTEEQQKAQSQAEKAGAENAAKGKAFLEENAKKEGVKTTASGLQYKVNKEGTGAMPKATDIVAVEYVGRLIDGTEFDNRQGDPVAFPLDQVIKGWTEGLQLMKEGAEYTFYIPAELGYGDRATGKIPPQSTLVFDVKLVKVEKEKK